MWHFFKQDNYYVELWIRLRTNECGEVYVSTWTNIINLDKSNDCYCTCNGICSIFISDEYECNEDLLKGAVLTATSYLRDRGPDNARLYGMTHW